MFSLCIPCSAGLKSVKNSEDRWSTLRLGRLEPHGRDWSSCEDLRGGMVFVFNLKGDWESPFPSVWEGLVERKGGVTRGIG